MQHAIKRDMVDDGSDLRNRSTRNSFRRAVDRTIDGQAPVENGTGEQRGVDGESDCGEGVCVSECGEGVLWLCERHPWRRERGSRGEWTVSLTVVRMCMCEGVWRGSLVVVYACDVNYD